MNGTMRVADYLTNALYAAGGETVFLITGGMIMHLTDALRQHGKQRFVCCHHEQAAVMAADAYGRMTNKLGVAYVTAGPAALNTLTGVVGAYVDSAPCIVVAGQSKVSQARVTGPRQFALQGYNTLPIFERAAKYAVMLNDVTRVRYEVEKCIHLATMPRVGPVWIEVPIDIQGAPFDPDQFEGYKPCAVDSVPRQRLRRQVAAVADDLRRSRRPCILAGAGIRQSGAVELLNAVVADTGIPVLTSRLGLDLMGYDNPLFVGHPGTYGDRPANFAVQNCDVLLSVGSRLALGMVGYGFEEFARHALKIMVDIDPQELDKPAVRPDVPLEMDARIFLEMLRGELAGFKFGNRPWIDQVQSWKERYPVDLPEYVRETDGINSYHFMARFSEAVPDNALFLCDTGSCFHVFAQAFKVKFGQRHIITGGLSTMGYSPASIGVAAAAPGQPVYCISGDGSIQFNLQEFQTIVHNRLPIKTIILNNNGYLLIRLTQRNFQGGRYIGTHAENGVSFPNMEKIATAYTIPYMRISSVHDLDAKLDSLIDSDGPLICEVMTPEMQPLIPRVAARQREDGSMESMPYDDMFPFLPREEYAQNCVRDTIL